MKKKFTKSILKFKTDHLKLNEGISLPIVIGLITVLFIGTVIINSIVIQGLRSIKNIEFSTGAYFLAEGGLEDALYELSSRDRGYQTGTLGSGTSRILNPNTIINPTQAGWNSEWSIRSQSGQLNWSGELRSGEKVTIPLYYDNSGNGVTTTTNQLNPNQFQATNRIRLPISGSFDVTFSIPNAASFSPTTLQIDNDQDGLLNEEEESIPCVGNHNCPPPGFCDSAFDCDGDGQLNEDRPNDIVLHWQMDDGQGHRLVPVSGCIIPNLGNASEICESDFSATNFTPYAITISNSTPGRIVSNDAQNGTQMSIGSFISNSGVNSPVTMELLLVAPLQHQIGASSVLIPYIQYQVNSVLTTQIPYPFFTIQSDGYVFGRKQSLTTTLYPQTNTSLLDFTVIQQ